VEQFVIERIDPDDIPLIHTVAGWYLREWNIPRERTETRLRDFGKNGFPFHLVLCEGNVPVATAGLYSEVGLHTFYPEYGKVGPWVALVYTVPEMRGRGIGALLCNTLEQMAGELGFNHLYLYTYTAEALYLRLGYQVMERVNYRGNDEVIMKKAIAC